MPYTSSGYLKSSLYSSCICTPFSTQNVFNLYPCIAEDFYFWLCQLRTVHITMLDIEAVIILVLLLQEYSTKQLTSLVNCGTGSHFSKKAKQRLLVVIEETERSRTR